MTRGIPLRLVGVTVPFALGLNVLHGGPHYNRENQAPQKKRHTTPLIPLAAQRQLHPEPVNALAPKGVHNLNV